MEVLETRWLRGPNLFSAHPCLLAVLADAPERLAGLGARLAALLPLAELPTPRDEVPLAVAEAVLRLQTLAGSTPAFALARPAAGGWELAVAYEHEAVVEAALPLALELVLALGRGETPDREPALARLRRLTERSMLGPSTRAIVEAARRRGIPVERLAPDRSLFQLGWGKFGRRIQATVTGETSHVATDIAQDKDLTKRLLAAAGLPVPRGQVVRTADEALEAARKLGGLVAIKPLDGNQGKGVSLNLGEPQAIRAAFELAADYASRVLVEEQIEGQDYRVLVVGHQVVAASHRLPAQVVGDGRASVAELVAHENRNPARGEGHLAPLTRIKLDENARQVLASQGLAPDAVPESGRVVLLRRNANLSTGGTARDVTATIHPANALACVRAAQRVGLDVAGIDVVCHDLAVPLEAQGGALIEVNAAPGIRMHQHPAAGEPRDVGAAIVAALFPRGHAGRVPLIAICSSTPHGELAPLLGRGLQGQGLVTGVCCSQGITIGGRTILAGPRANHQAACIVLGEPEVEAAVLDLACLEVAKHGLAFDACDVAIILDGAPDEWNVPGELRRIKGLLVRHAERAVVLDARDPQASLLASQRRPWSELLLFAPCDDEPMLHAHLQAGGRAAYLSGGEPVLAHGQRRFPLRAVEGLPVADLLAAAAALWAQGRTPEAIATALAGPAGEAPKLNVTMLADEFDRQRGNNTR